MSGGRTWVMAEGWPEDPSSRSREYKVKLKGRWAVDGELLNAQ